MHATKELYASFYRAITQRIKTQIDLKYTPSHLPAHGEFENLHFVSLAPMVCMLRELFKMR